LSSFGLSPPFAEIVHQKEKSVNGKKRSM